MKGVKSHQIELRSVAIAMFVMAALFAAPSAQASRGSEGALHATQSPETSSPLSAIAASATSASFQLALEQGDLEGDNNSDNDGRSVAYSFYCEQRKELREELAASDSAAKRALAELIESEELRRCRIIEVLDVDWDFDREERQQDWGWVKALSMLLELALWLAVALIIALIAWQIARRWRSGQWRRPAPAPRPAPLVVHGVEVVAESALSDQGSAAWQLWQAGRAREALALLYRSTLAALMLHNALHFDASQTEQECLDAARDKLSSSASVQLLSVVTRLWQRLAYAHRPPASAEVESLCRRWSELFAPGALSQTPDQ